MSAEIGHTASSGNVFADLGFPNPEEAQAKAQLAHRISTIIRHRRLTQEQAAEVLGIDQPRVSGLMRGRLRSVSIDLLVKYLTTLGQDVDIVVGPKESTEEYGKVSVHGSIAARDVLERARGKYGSLRADALTQAHTDRRRLRVPKEATRYLRAKHDQ